MNDGRHRVQDDQVATGLASSDGRVVYFALQAAPPVAKDPEVRAELVRLASSGKPHEAIPALEILSEPDRFSLDDAVSSAFFEALSSDQPAIVLTALDRMEIDAESLAARPGFWEQVMSLTSHSHPFVRGRALETVIRMAAPADEAALKSHLRAKLSDQHPYVRSKAAEGLGELGDKVAIPELLKLLDDHRASDVKASYIDLLGETVELEDTGSTWSRVDDAALFALHMLDVFEYGQIDPDHVDRDIQREIRRARAARS